MSARRIAGVASAVVGGLVVIAAVLAAVMFVPAWLRDAPSKVYTADTEVTLLAGEEIATLTVPVDWVRMGLWPAWHAISVLSPDGRYRADLALHAGAVPADPAVALIERLRAGTEAEAAVGAVLPDPDFWNSEELLSGARVRHVTVEVDGESHFVGVWYRDGAPGWLSMRARLDGPDRGNYRLVDALLLTSVDIS